MTIRDDDPSIELNNNKYMCMCGVKKKAGLTISLNTYMINVLENYISQCGEKFWKKFWESKKNLNFVPSSKLILTILYNNDISESIKVFKFHVESK